MSDPIIPPAGPYPSQGICPNCKRLIQTTIEAKTSTKTHIIALLLCVVCCCLCAPCVYCTNCARNVEHSCPACGAYIGTYVR